MSNPRASHRFVKLAMPQQGTDVKVAVVHLFRESDGMRVATAKGELVQFGEDPQQQRMRVFIDHNRAVGFLRGLADRDWAVEKGLDPAAPDFLTKAAGYAAVIDEEDHTPRIISPDQMRRIPTLN